MASYLKDGLDPDPSGVPRGPGSPDLAARERQHRSRALGRVRAPEPRQGPAEPPDVHAGVHGRVAEEHGGPTFN